MLYIGIDLGTSAVKILLMKDGGRVLKTVSESYPVNFPQTGWSEQNPKDWFEGTVKGIKRILDGYDGSEVGGISFGGQMHGLTLLDETGDVLLLRRFSGSRRMSPRISQGSQRSSCRRIISHTV